MIKIDNYKFRNEKGIIPAIMKPLLDIREETKKEMKKLDKNSNEYKSLDLHQYTLKVITNSFYGVMGMKYFRLYNNECASATTYIARKIIKEVHSWFKEKGYNVVYGDTDSMFVEMGNATIEDMIKLNKEINLYFKDYFKQFGIEEKNNIFKLEFEKVFKRVFFKRKANGEGAKKKYAGRTIYPKDDFEVTGFESRRSDSPDVGREFMKEVLRMICYEIPEEEIKRYIEDFKQKIKTKFTPEEIGLPISITKSLDKYANQIHARAARLANEKHKSQIQQGDKIKYIYVKGTPNVIAWKSEGYCPEGYEIDYSAMIRRIIDLKIEPLFNSLGWDYGDLKTEIKKEIKEKKIKQSQKQLI